MARMKYKSGPRTGRSARRVRRSVWTWGMKHTKSGFRNSSKKQAVRNVFGHFR